MNRTSDVLIIGGGITGLSSAYYLNKAGRSVRIIERGAVGSGSSRSNCGLIVPSAVYPLCSFGALAESLLNIFNSNSPLYIRPSLDFGRIMWLVHFAGKCNSKYAARVAPARLEILNASTQLYKQLLDEEGIRCQWNSGGNWYVYKSKQNMAGFAEASRRLEDRFGISATAYSRDALLAKEPRLDPSVCGGHLLPMDACLKPELLLEQLKAVLLNRGGTVINEETNVTKMIVSGNVISGVETTDGEYRADEYVLAAGAWSPQFARELGARIPIQPGRGYSLTTRGQFESAPSIAFHCYERKVVITPFESELRVGGTMELAGYHTKPSEKRLRTIISSANEYLVEPLEFEAMETWDSLRPMMCDDMPIIGRSPRQRNLVVAAGHGMLGMSMGPSTGKLVSELIVGGQTHIDREPWRMERFN
jgi:D-amino-acid dehydrogenase